VTSTPVLVYLDSAVVGQVLMGAICLRFGEEESAGVKGHLDDSGVGEVQVRMRMLMFAQNQYLWELLVVVMGLVSPYQVTVSSVAWLRFPSVYPLSFLVRSRLTKPLSQLRALPSVVESCRLAGE